jgi:CheY-like chemotaxis protein
VTNGLQILVAEDSALQAAVLQRLLSEGGYLVTVAKDGQEAWEHLDKSYQAPALVLSDIEMPNMDGYDLAIVKRIVEGRGGTVTLDSEPGRGCTFILRLVAPEPT